MTLAEMVHEELKNMGFETEVNGDEVIVGLTTRRVSFLEIEIALDFMVSRNWMRRIGSGRCNTFVAISL